MLNSYSQPDNQVVLWDRIVRRKRDSKINVQDLRQKYAFKEMGKSGFRYVETFPVTAYR